MKPHEALRGIERAAGNAGWLFLNAIPTVPKGVRDWARGAVCRAARLSRPTRSNKSRLPLAIAAAENAARAVAEMARVCTSPGDATVIIAPAVYLREAAAVARACLAPGDTALAEAARLAAIDSAAALAAARAATEGGLA